MKIELVPLSLIHKVWPEVEGFLKEALKHGEDDYTIEQAKVYVTRGEWMLVVASNENIEGASIINFYNMPNQRIAFVVAIGGRLISNHETYAQFCEILKSFGATRIRGVARESVARLWKRYGFRERYTLVEAEL
jgi:hypothetical protein